MSSSRRGARAPLQKSPGLHGETLRSRGLGLGGRSRAKWHHGANGAMVCLTYGNQFGIQTVWYVWFMFDIQKIGMFGIQTFSKYLKQPIFVTRFCMIFLRTGFGIDVPFWGLVSHHFQVSVGDEISPIFG